MHAHELSTTPPTDEGTVPNLRFSFSDAHDRIEPGGRAREVTRRELPVATALAGVNMRLDAGAVRELHWHKQAEWAFMLEGRARITAFDEDGQSFVDDVGEDDLWYFPAGVPHSIQALEYGCEFLLVFDDGGFSENATFLLTDWLAHTPREVLAQNLAVDAGVLSTLPDGERYIFRAPVPPPLDARRDPAFAYRLSRQAPVATPGGRVRVVDTGNFPVSRTVAAALVEVDPGGLRELHWHPNADEWQYYISGSARMTVFAAESAARTFEYGPRDVGYVPFAMGHYVLNTGDDVLRFLEVFRSDRFADISLSRWLAHTPAELVREHLHVGESALAGLHREERPVVR